MMIDAELVYAARAAGFELTHVHGIGVGYWGSRDFVLWDPREYCGDAFRLVVKLGLAVCVMKEAKFIGIYLPTGSVGGKYDVMYHYDSDPYTATLLAITMAAAEIGKTLPPLSQ